MIVSDSLTLAPLQDLLLRYEQQQWTGKVLLEGIGRHRLRNSLFLHRGRLVWATGGIHPVRRWQRHLRQNGGQVTPATLALQPRQPRTGCWDYELLQVLWQRGHLPSDRLKPLLQGIITDMLWDLLQWTALAQLQPAPGRWSLRDYAGVQPSSRAALSPAPTLTVTAQLAIAQQQWQQWQSAGLTRTSPHLTAKLLVPQRFAPQQINSAPLPNPYPVPIDAGKDVRWERLLNGQRSLRELAGVLGQDLVPLMRSLRPHLTQGVLVLEAIADLPRPT